MFNLVGFNLSTEEGEFKNQFQFNNYGLTLSQLTLIEGTQVDIFVKFPEDESIDSLKIATVTKSLPNICLHQLELPTGSVIYCKGSGVISCIANEPIQNFIKHKCYEKDNENEINSESTSSEIESDNNNVKSQKPDFKSEDSIKEKVINTQKDLIKPGYKREFNNGLKYEVISISKNIKSDTPQIALTGSKVHVKYEGRLAKTGKKFDSGTITFTIGCGEVIQGFDQGVKGMIVSETRRIFIPSKLGYGIKGCPPIIPKNSDLVFEITLLNTKH